jgi:hypothetical protein
MEYPQPDAQRYALDLEDLQVVFAAKENENEAERSILPTNGDTHNAGRNTLLCYLL